jgi:hypothetical protein
LAPVPGTATTGAAVGALGALAGAVADITAVASPVEVMAESATDEAGVAQGPAAATRSMAVAAVPTAEDFTGAVASMEAVGMVAEGMAAVIAKRG